MFKNRGENFGKMYKGRNLNDSRNRYNIDLENGGVGDPQAWYQDYVGNWIYAPRYLVEYEIPYEFRNNIERIRMEKDPNLDNWDQRYDGQWEYHPYGNPSIQEKKRQEVILARQREIMEERRRLEEGEDEIRSAESYHSETSQPSDIPGMLTPKMPNLEHLPINEYNRELIKSIRRSYKKLKEEYPTRPMGDRLRGLNWPELENFKNLVFELNFQRKAIFYDQEGIHDFIYPTQRGVGPLTDMTPFSITSLGFGGTVPRTRANIEDEPYNTNTGDLVRHDNGWNGYITPEHSSQREVIERATGIQRIPATIRYWILHSKITWRIYTGDYSIRQRIVDTLTRIITEEIRAGRDYRQTVRDYLLQQGVVGREIENLFQSLSSVLLELMNLPGNILSIPQTAYNYLKDLFNNLLESRRVTQPTIPVIEPMDEPTIEPGPEIISHFRPYRARTKRRKKYTRRRKTNRKRKIPRTKEDIKL
tara:strand:- start:1467 stop:2894 length:1428 start_codon:yes stop_codon:yes gene_type:complete